MAKKVIIILIVVIVLAGGVFAVMHFINSGSQTASAPVEPSAGGLGNVPSQAVVPSLVNFPNAPQGDSFTLGTSRGSVVIKNFYNTPMVLSEEFLILQDTNDYQITYDTLNNQFFVYAASTPLNVARQKGEAGLLQLLGISKQDACKLDVAEGYPQNSALANEQPGLSFCAGGAFQAN